MAKYRKKPVVIYADQWFPGEPLEGVREQPSDAGMIGIIETAEGDMIAQPGDWIITGVNGEKYPCREDIFYRTYQPATEN